MTIKEIRQAAGLTQKGMSELLHIPKRTIEDWETGKRNPPDYLIELIRYRLEALIELTRYRLEGEKDEI